MTPIEQVINTISAEQADRLYWLGRYVERVFSTLRLFNRSLDRMIDQNGDDYVDFCRRLSIPSEIYAGPEDFETRYLFDPANPDSIYSNLSRAYDNAIVLRNFITTETMAYIQLALDQLQHGARADSAFLETQRVADWLLAFWGSESTPNVWIFSFAWTFPSTRSKLCCRACCRTPSAWRRSWKSPCWRNCVR